MINITEIGITAGEIWQSLDKNGSETLEGLTRSIGKDRDLILMSLGWLAREGHIEVETAAQGYRATLKEKKPADK